MCIKSMKSTAVILCSILVSCAAVYADDAIKIESYNKIGSDIVKITDDSSAFAGMYDRFVTDITSDRVDAGIDAKMQLTTNEWGRPDAISLNKDKWDWYAAFRPVRDVTLGFSTNYWLAGSYLVIEDDNIAGGKMGSDGFTAAYSGIPGLTLAVTAPFGFDEESDGPDKFDDKDAEPEKYFTAGIGGEYNFKDKVFLGVTVHDAANDDTRGWGVYGSFVPSDSFVLYAGYGYRDKEGLCDVSGNNLVNASFKFTPGVFLFEGDYITNINGDKGNAADCDIFYAAADIGYNVTDEVLIEAGGTVHAEYGNADKGKYVLKPALIYTHKTLGEFKVEADITWIDQNFDNMCFPLYWKYSF